MEDKSNVSAEERLDRLTSPQLIYEMVEGVRWCTTLSEGILSTGYSYPLRDVIDISKWNVLMVWNLSCFLEWVNRLKVVPED